MRQRAANVHAERGVEPLHRQLLDAPAPCRAAGIVHQDVDPAVRVERRLDRALGIGLGTGVGLDGRWRRSPPPPPRRDGRAAR